MKKRNLVLLSVLCLLFVSALSCLLIFTFDRQRNKTTPASVPTSTPDHTPSATEAPTPEPTPTTAPTATPLPTAVPEKPITLGFAGDVNLDENYYPIAKYTNANDDINSLFSEDLIDEMTQVDLMLLNNEFAYSTRGTKEANKAFTFRAKPERVNILKKIGVDLVSLANNHALDYGQDALIDTFSTLDSAEIDYIGAGENMARAKAPVYKTVGNKTIAFVAASRVVFDMDWYATDTTPGMVGTYDPSTILEAIREAKDSSDFVVMFVHWGVERNSYPEDYQRTLAQQYIDAGADVVVGCHPHVMQGFEYYNGKLIAYSLGNYLFNNSTKRSGMLKLYLDPDGDIRTQILPVMNKATKTFILTEASKRKNYFDYMEQLSYNTVIDDDGFISEDVK